MHIAGTVDVVDAADIVDIAHTVDIVDIVDTVDTLNIVHAVDKGKMWLDFWHAGTWPAKYLACQVLGRGMPSTLYSVSAQSD